MSRIPGSPPELGSWTHKIERLNGLEVRVVMRQDLSFKAVALPCDSMVTVDAVRLCVVPSKR